MVGGHSLIRMVNRESGADIVFNWGVFDFDEPNFVLKFLRGNIDYRMAAYSSANSERHYQMERRSIVEEKLNLTPKQKSRLLAGIIYASQPENLYFRYHYYFANCATKVRDQIDAAIEGKLAAALLNRNGSESLRAAVRKHFGYFPGASMALEIMMNSDIDATMSAWEEMFLPARMQTYLQELSQYDDQGNIIPNTKLLGPPQTIQHFEEPKDWAMSGSYMLFCSLFPLCLFVIVAHRFMPQCRALCFRVAGVLSIAWGLFAAFFGVSMLLIWFGSEHVHGRHSANLWILNPLGLVLVCNGYHWLRYTRARPVSAIYFGWNAALVGCVAMAGILSGIGVIQQDLSQTLIPLGGITLALTSYAMMLGMRIEK